tara:strand:- start:491 stop:985 length:495 start_codon:yes stop_codon:yes gene_type:complete
VLARAEGADAEWLEVGHVSTAPDAATELVGASAAASAVQLHKRLVLKHAARVYPIQIGTAQTVELAVREAPRPAGPDEEEEGDSAAAAAASVPLAEPLPLEAVPAALREECGFSGIPDANSGGYWTDTTPIPAAGKAVKIGDGTKKDSKSAVAEQFSAMLGLRN